MNSKNQIRIAAAVMFLAVGLGAMGAHALEEKLTETGHTDDWKTAALYQMIHGVAMFVVAAAGNRSRPAFCYWAWLVGVVLFSGSIYLLCLTGIKALPVVLATPLGGLSFMAGWLALIVKPGQICGRNE